MIRKKIVGLAVAICLMLASFAWAFPIAPAVSRVSGAAAKAAETANVSLTVHYYRYGEDYTKWDAWIWADGAEGVAVAFPAANTDTYGIYLTTTVKAVSLGETSKGIGFLLRKGSWDEQDIKQDRFIPVNKIVENRAEIFLVEGDTNIYYSESEADKSPKFRTAVFDDAKTIRATLTNALTDELQEGLELRVNGSKISSSELASSEIVNGRKYVKYSLKNDASFASAYTVYSAVLGEKVVSFEKMFDSDAFKAQFDYNGELGAIYSPTKTVFKVWAPTASEIKLNRYQEGSGNNLIEQTAMVKGEKGVWQLTVSGDIHGEYYTYTVTAAGLTNEVVDPYTKSAGVNGRRGMVIDPSKYNPDGWGTQKVNDLESNVDAVIYEAHLRDLTIDASSGVSAANRGKYLGLTEKDTKNTAGLSTAVDHMAELGITEVHFQPLYDFGSIDESKPETAQFNWGYDPQNYNVPEGSYSSDAAKGEVRVSELKQMVMALHNRGIRVVMDVVYNHTYKSADSSFNLIVPNYYYRMTSTGAFSNGSGCGNETASERTMFGKFMLDSLLYWQQEYKIDGFRFDLMALHDIDTMNKIADELLAKNPATLLYGEGWTGGTTPLPAEKQALKKNAKKMPKIAVFSDDIRDGVKGSVFDGGEPGFVQGQQGYEDRVRMGIVGATGHAQVGGGWAANPTQSINYVSAHDNYTLHDKIELSAESATQEEREKMNRLSGAIVLTSQGVPFFLAGEEMLRSKPLAGGTYDHNSYQSPDSVNSIKWDEKTENKQTFDFYKNLIALRKAMPQLRLRTGAEVGELVVFYDDIEETNLIGYTIYYTDAGGVLRETVVLLNANKQDKQVTLAKSGDYDVFVDGDEVSTEKLRTVSGRTVTVKAIGAMVLIKQPAQSGQTGNIGLIVGLSVGGGVLVLGGGALAIVLLGKKSKNKAKGEK